MEEVTILEWLMNCIKSNISYIIVGAVSSLFALCIPFIFGKLRDLANRMKPSVMREKLLDLIDKAEDKFKGVKLGEARVAWVINQLPFIKKLRPKAMTKKIDNIIKYKKDIGIN